MLYGSYMVVKAYKNKLAASDEAMSVTKIESLTLPIPDRSAQLPWTDLHKMYNFTHFNELCQWIYRSCAVTIQSMSAEMSWDSQSQSSILVTVITSLLAASLSLHAFTAVYDP